MGLAVGEMFAGNNIVRVLCAGATGTVYLAQHPRFLREEHYGRGTSKKIVRPPVTPAISTQNLCGPAVGSTW